METYMDKKNSHFKNQATHNKLILMFHLFFLTIINNSNSHIASCYSLKPRLLNIQVISSKIDSLLSCVELL